MVILSFLATLLWIAMLIGFLVAVFWVIAIVVFIRGYKRWVHGDQRNGFADWAKEGHVEAHLLGPFALARSARVIKQSAKSIKAPRFELGVMLMGKMVSSRHQLLG